MGSTLDTHVPRYYIHMAFLQDAAPFLAAANVSDFKYLLFDRSHQCMDAIQSAMYTYLLPSRILFGFFVEDPSQIFLSASNFGPPGPQLEMVRAD